VPPLYDYYCFCIHVCINLRFFFFSFIKNYLNSKFLFYFFPLIFKLFYSHLQIVQLLGGSARVLWTGAVLEIKAQEVSVGAQQAQK
jgi:hypothetical protein